MSYFRSDQQFIYLNYPYCEFYIPMSYFDNGGFATDHGKMIKVLGVFNAGFFDKNGKLTEMRVLNIPTEIEVFVYDSETKAMRLPGEDLPVICKVLKFYENNKVLNSSIIEDSSNAEEYLGFITKGKIPQSVPYNKTHKIWEKNQSLNSVDLGVPSIIEELILSVSYRSKTNPNIKFAHVIGKNPKTSQYDYTMASTRQICQYASTFTGLTFEDIDSMITTSLNRTRDKKPEAYSPIEKIIKM